jgi:hypothetical protein
MDDMVRLDKPNKIKVREPEDSQNCLTAMSSNMRPGSHFFIRGKLC